MSRLSLGLLCAFTVCLQTACEKRLTIDEDGQETETLHFVGQPRPEDRWQAPHAITDFTKLYTKYCLACHSIGPDTVSPVVAMDNPDYLATIPPEALRNAIANGIPGSLMPGFSKQAGGDMTDAQITILVDGILARKPATPPADVPPYSAPLGDAAAGKALYESSIYGKNEPGQSILAPAYLSTVTDQYLRTLLIAGLPKLGFPGFRELVPGRTLTSQEISDLTAWIVSNRKNEYGQPLPPAATPSPGLPAEPPAPDSPAAEQVP